ncbi:uncharacterized protein VTP21DRAFT_7003 [Calcarisporiella thermophila]|uniref:uncharacterized protein n=1 Tax=Calcarisporiella thermophila TaxID=911321 RepID=UPI0037439650
MDASGAARRKKAYRKRSSDTESFQNGIQLRPRAPSNPSSIASESSHTSPRLTGQDASSDDYLSNFIHRNTSPRSSIDHLSFSPSARYADPIHPPEPLLGIAQGVPASVEDIVHAQQQTIAVLETKLAQYADIAERYRSNEMLLEEGTNLVSALTSQCSNLERNLADTQRKLGEAQRQNGELLGKLKEKNEHIEKLNRKLIAHTKELNNNIRLLDGHRVHIEQLRQQMQDNIVSHDHETAELRGQVQQLERLLHEREEHWRTEHERMREVLEGHVRRSEAVENELALLRVQRGSSVNGENADGPEEDARRMVEGLAIGDMGAATRQPIRAGGEREAGEDGGEGGERGGEGQLKGVLTPKMSKERLSLKTVRAHPTRSDQASGSTDGAT